jgi:hypothetical protein
MCRFIGAAYADVRDESHRLVEIRCGRTPAWKELIVSTPGPWRSRGLGRPVRLFREPSQQSDTRPKHIYALMHYRV